MSSSNDQAGTTSSEEIDHELVLEYLRNHSDFLQRNPEILDYQHISHASGSAVSLVEKQISVMRERNVEMRHRLNALTDNARDNDKLYEQTRALILQLVEATSVAQLCHAFTAGMQTGFAVENSSIILFDDEAGAGDYRVETQEDAKVAIGPLLRERKPVCGTLRAEEMRYLFPDAKNIGSVALVRLHANGANLGLIAVGSSDANRYHNTMGTLFLSHIADIIVRLLPQLPRRRL